ncbi:MAG TPA: hypothetical protein VH253_18370 [Phycisphaerae bacterium]|nr:hypothetical protein [Phycisphaerae bacterium]
MVLLALVAQPLFAEDKDQRLGELFDQWKSVTSIVMKATDSTTYHNRLLDPRYPETTVVETEFSYVASGVKYNIISSSDPATSPDSDFRFAFDGNHFQLFNRTNKSLAFQKGDRPRHPTLFPNPVFAPFEFISKTDDAHRNFAIELDLIQDMSVRDAVIRSASWVAGEGGDEVASIPGSVVNGKPFSFRVYFRQKAGVPYKIERVYGDGTVVNSTEIQYKDGAGGLPAHVPDVVHRINYYGDKHVEYSNGLTHITKISLNSPVDERDFTIDYKSATTIYDFDSKEYVTSPDTDSPEQEISGVSAAAAVPDTAQVTQVQDRALWLSLLIAVVVAAVGIAIWKVRRWRT